MKDTGVVGYRLSRPTDAKYIGDARLFLGKLKNIFKENKFGSYTKRLNDGTRIGVLWLEGAKYVNINTDDVYEGTESTPRKRGMLVYPAGDAGIHMGWGKPKDEEHPKGTVIGDITWAESPGIEFPEDYYSSSERGYSQIALQHLELDPWVLITQTAPIIEVEDEEAIPASFEYEHVQPDEGGEFWWVNEDKSVVVAYGNPRYPKTLWVNGTRLVCENYNNPGYAPIVAACVAKYTDDEGENPRYYLRWVVSESVVRDVPCSAGGIPLDEDWADNTRHFSVGHRAAEFHQADFSQDGHKLATATLDAVYSREIKVYTHQEITSGTVGAYSTELVMERADIGWPNWELTDQITCPVAVDYIDNKLYITGFDLDYKYDVEEPEWSFTGWERFTPDLPGYIPMPKNTGYWTGPLVPHEKYSIQYEDRAVDIPYGETDNHIDVHANATFWIEADGVRVVEREHQLWKYEDVFVGTSLRLETGDDIITTFQKVGGFSQYEVPGMSTFWNIHDAGFDLSTWIRWQPPDYGIYYDRLRSAVEGCDPAWPYTVLSSGESVWNYTWIEMRAPPDNVLPMPPEYEDEPELYPYVAFKEWHDPYNEYHPACIYAGGPDIDSGADINIKIVGYDAYHYTAKTYVTETQRYNVEHAGSMSQKLTEGECSLVTTVIDPATGETTEIDHGVTSPYCTNQYTSPDGATRSYERVSIELLEKWLVLANIYGVPGSQKPDPRQIMRTLWNSAVDMRDRTWNASAYDLYKSYDVITAKHPTDDYGFFSVKSTVPQPSVETEPLPEVLSWVNVTEGFGITGFEEELQLGNTGGLVAGQWPEWPVNAFRAKCLIT